MLSSIDFDTESLLARSPRSEEFALPLIVPCNAVLNELNVTAPTRLILLDAMVVIYIVLSYRLHRAAAYLFVPYIVWLAVATYLNAYIFIYN